MINSESSQAKDQESDLVSPRPFLLAVMELVQV